MKTLDRIILVDDDLDTNFYNRIVLDGAQVSKEILIFDNSREALDYLQNENDKVDLILLDINMPNINGWQFLEYFEQLDDKRKKAISVVMLTSSANSDDKKKAEKIDSIKAFINKPLIPEKINEIISLFD